MGLRAPPPPPSPRRRRAVRPPTQRPRWATAAGPAPRPARTPPGRPRRPGRRETRVGPRCRARRRPKKGKGCWRLRSPAPLPVRFPAPAPPSVCSGPPTLATGGGHLALTPLAGFLVVAVLAEVRQNASLLALLLEPLERTLEALIVRDGHFRHAVPAPVNRLRMAWVKACSVARPPASFKGRAHPGGHAMARPPSRCACRWNTLWPASALVLMTTREPRPASPSARATSRACTSSFPKRPASVASLSVATWARGITRMWVGAWGLTSRNATKASSCATMAALISPRAILQNRHSVMPSPSHSPQHRAFGRAARPETHR